MQLPSFRRPLDAFTRALRNRRTARLTVLAMPLLAAALFAPTISAASASSPGASIWGFAEYIASFLYGSDGPSDGPMKASPVLEDKEEAKSDSGRFEITPPDPACASTGVTLNVGPAQTFTTIQSAINAANPLGGDTINVAAGTYTEQLIVNKCVFINGAGIGQTIIQSPPVLNPSPLFASRQAIVEVRANAYAAISGVTITGPVEFDMPTYGVWVNEDSTLQLSNSRVTNIWKSTGIDGVQNGLAIGAGNTAVNTTGHLIANNVTVDNFQKNGITIDRLGSSATITNTNVTGIGPTNVIAQNGIQIGRGAAGTITGGNLTAHEYTGGSTVSAGALVFDAGAVSISGVNFAANDASIYHYYFSGPSDPFTASGNTLASVHYGIVASGNTATIENNFISGGVIGIGLWPTDTNSMIVRSNSITGAADAGIYTDDYSGTVSLATLNAEFNRIAGSAQGLANDSNSPFNAVNNFWGCNAGPGGVGCSTVAAGTGPVDANPWLVLSGIQADDNSLPNGAAANISGVNLRYNSDGVNTFTALPGNLSVPDGIVINYAASGFGTVAPASGSTLDGLLVPNAVFTAAAGPFSGDQVANVTATLDSAVDTVAITVEDNTAPTVTINQVGPDPTTSSTINFTVVFSEATTDFATGDVALSGSAGATSAVVAQIAPNDGTTYNVAVSGMTGSGLVTAAINAGVATDPAGNPNSVSTSTDNTVSYFTSGIELVVDDDGKGSAFSCDDSTGAYSDIPAALAAASSGYTIKVCPGTHVVTNNNLINLAGLTITAFGETPTDKAIVSTNGSSLIFTVTAANVSFIGLDFVKTDTSSQNLINPQGTGFTASGNTFTANTPWTSGDLVMRALDISSTATGLNISGNTFTDFRQPAYINGDGETPMGNISNNIAVRTKGWNVDGAIIDFSGNSFETCSICGTDISLYANGNNVYRNYYLSRLDFAGGDNISENNNNAHVDVQFTSENDSGRAASYVANGGSASNNGQAGSPYASIQQAIYQPTGNVIDGTLPGGTVNIATGTYIEDVLVDRRLKIAGAGASGTIVSGPSGGDGATIRIAASATEVTGLRITRRGNNTTDWNDPGLNFAGIAIQGTATTGALIHDNEFVGNRTAIDINNSNGHTIRNNVVTDNRTGLIFRNQTENIDFTENTVTGNWTVGILFLDASGGTKSPVQSAVNSTFSNNNISGNWYGQIVDRQSGGSLPAPGANLKNFQGNWLGTTSPSMTTADSAEPDYASLIPVGYGGSATAPSSQPGIAGPASANIRYNQVLTSGTDTNVETVIGRGTFGFQGAPIYVQSQAPSGWFFFNEGASGTGDFAIGPNPAPLGDGSARLSVDANGRQSFGTFNYGGIRLDDITHLRYSSYQVSGNPAVAIALQFDVDNDITNGSADYQGRLVFEPYLTPGNVVQQGQWQSWDPLAGRWWGSSTSNTSAPPRPVTVACPQSNPCTWSQILTLFPNAGIRAAADSGTLLFRAGGPVNTSFDGYVDAFEIGINTAETTFDFEPGRPTVTIDQAGSQADPTNVSPINFTVVFSTPVTGFEDSDVVLAGTAAPTTAVVAQIAPNDGTTYNVAVSGMSNDGTVTASVADGAASGLGGQSVASTSTDNAVTFDQTAPILNPVACVPFGPGQFNCAVTFTEPVTNFTSSDITVGNGILSAFGGSGASYTFSVAQSSTQPAAVQIGPGAAFDLAGNPSTGTVSTSVDNVSPTAVITADAASTSTSPVTFTVNFSEPVTDFDDAADIDLSASTTGGTLVAFISGSGPYTISVSGMNGNGNVVASVNSGAAADAAGNLNSAGGPASTAFTVTNTPFTVTPTNLQNWSIISQRTGDSHFAAGPGTTPMGTGSLRMIAGPGNAGPPLPLSTTGQGGKTWFARGDYNNVPLSTVTDMRYSTYVTTRAAGTLVAPAINLQVDIDGNGTRDAALVYEPAYSVDTQGATQVGQWQSWNARAGKWWFTGSSFTNSPSFPAQFCPSSCFNYYSDIIAAFPNARIVNWYPRTDGLGLQFVTGQNDPGSPWNDFDGNIDGIVFGVNSANTTFDLEAAPPTVSISDATLNEGNSGTANAVFTVSLDQAAAIDVSVTVNTADGTATSGSDYAAAVNQAVTIPAGQLSIPVNVTVNGDQQYEPHEAFTVTLSNAANATIGDATGAGTITNDDAQPFVQFQAAAAVSNETDGPAVTSLSITVTRTGAVGDAFGVDYALGGGSAAGGASCGSGVDYLNTGGTVNFAAGDVSKTFNVDICGDDVWENDETFNITLSNQTAPVGLGSPAVHTVTIDEDETEPTLSIAKTADGVENPNAPTTFDVTLSGQSAFAVTVQFATSDGSATGGSDFVNTSGTLTFNAGTATLSQQITVPVLDDNAVEGVEDLSVSITAPTNAAVQSGSATATITSEDVCTWSLSSASQNFAIAGGLGSFNVTVNPGCSWTAVSNAPWITTASTGVGTAPAGEPVGYTVAANVGGARTGTIQIRDAGNSVQATFTVNQAPAPVNVDIADNLAGSNGDSLTIPVNVLSDTTGRGILSFDFEITYDPNVLVTPTISNVGTISSTFSVGLITVDTDTIRVSGFALSDPLAGSGVLVNLGFNVTGTAPNCSTLHFDSFSFNGGNPADLTSDGQVCVLFEDVSGTVLYGNATTPPVPVPGVQLNASGSSPVSATTDGGGNYTLTGFGAGAYTVTPTKTGDVNGAITPFDAGQVQLHVLSVTGTLNATQLIVADVSGDLTISTFDAALIQQYFLGNTIAGNQSGTWRFDPDSVVYANLAAPQAPQNYNALLMGDVSGNWVTETTSTSKELLPKDAPLGGIAAILPTIQRGPAQDFDIPVIIGDVTGQGVISFNFDLIYDPAIIQPQATRTSSVGTLSASYAVGSSIIAPGRLRVSGFALTFEPMSGSGLLVNVKMRTASVITGGSTAISFSPFRFNEGSPASAPQAGSVQILNPSSAPTTISGRVVAANGRVIGDATVTVTDENGAAYSARTSSFGHFVIDRVPSGRTYVLSTRAKKYTFTNSVLSVTAAIDGLVIQPER